MQTLLISKNFIVLTFQTLMFQCCFFEYLLVSLWRNFDETLMFLIQTLIMRSLFKLLVSEIFMFHYRVSDDSLMILRRNNVESAKILTQTLMMIWLFEVLIFETLMFLSLLHWWFIDDSLIRPWWWTMEISMQTLLVIKDFVVLFFSTLRLHCRLIIYSLMSFWRNIDGTLMILMQTLVINFLFKVLISGTLLKILMC